MMAEQAGSKSATSKARGAIIAVLLRRVRKVAGLFLVLCDPLSIIHRRSRGLLLKKQDGQVLGFCAHSGWLAHGPHAPHEGDRKQKRQQKQYLPRDSTIHARGRLSSLNSEGIYALNCSQGPSYRWIVGLCL